MVLDLTLSSPVCDTYIIPNSKALKLLVNGVALLSNRTQTQPNALFQTSTSQHAYHSLHLCSPKLLIFLTKKLKTYFP